jgi:hypothetical protein
LPAVKAGTPDYQVSVWQDNATADFDDFFNPGLVLNLADFAPNTGVATASHNNEEPCLHNSLLQGYGDINIGSDDVTDFISETGRSTYFKPCPGCRSN